MVFAQEEAGTAVCISDDGLLLTRSHCVAETAQDLETSRFHRLLFKSGRAVRAKCVVWDPLRDLALLQVVDAQDGDTELQPPEVISFPLVHVGDASPVKNAVMICIGHPGSEDLEASQPGILPNYDVLHVSTGRFRGYAEQGLQDNSKIGALRHDRWTYWGHSGGDGGLGIGGVSGTTLLVGRRDGDAERSCVGGDQRIPPEGVLAFGSSW